MSDHNQADAKNNGIEEQKGSTDLTAKSEKDKISIGSAYCTSNSKISLGSAVCTSNFKSASESAAGTSVKLNNDSTVSNLSDANASKADADAKEVETCSKATAEPKSTFFPARLEGLGGNMDPRQLLIELNTPVFKMGRSFQVDLLLRDMNISSVHAVFEFSETHSAWTVTDKSSGNGIKVNRRRLVKDVPKLLNFQDVIELAELTDKFKWKLRPSSDKENMMSESNQSITSSNQNLGPKKRSCDFHDGSAKRVKFEAQDKSPKISLKMLEKEKLEKRLLAKQLQEREKEEARKKLEAEQLLEKEKQEKQLLARQLQEREKEEERKKQEAEQMLEKEKQEKQLLAQKLQEREKEEERKKQEAEQILEQEKQEKLKLAKEIEEQAKQRAEEKERLESEMTRLKEEKERLEAEHRLAAEMAVKEEEERKAKLEWEEAGRREQEAKMQQQLQEKEAQQRLQEEEYRVRLERMETTLTVSKDQGAKEILTSLEDTMETQTVCSTCLELPIHPVFLNCGHSFCWLCLHQWKRAKGNNTCPNCRTKISTETKGIIMENFIEALISKLGPAKVEERRLKVQEREEEERKFREIFEAGERARQPAQQRGGRAQQNRGRGAANSRGGAANQRGGAANQRGGAANRRGGPASQRGGPANTRAGAVNQRGGAANQRGGVANQRGGAANQQGRGGAAANQPGPAMIPQIFNIVHARSNVIQAAAMRAMQAAATATAPPPPPTAQNEEEAIVVSSDDDTDDEDGGQNRDRTGGGSVEAAQPDGSDVNVGAESGPEQISDADSGSARSSSRDSDDDSRENYSDGSDSSSSVEGEEGHYYGGYGRCFNCQRRGHWAPGCPY